MLSVIPQRPNGPTRHQTRKWRVFNTIFPPSSSASIPTPLASPNTSFTANTPVSATALPSTPHLRGVTSFLQATPDNFVVHTRMWHLATSFLSFPDAPFNVAEEEGVIGAVEMDALYVRRKRELCGKETKEAIAYLMRLEIEERSDSLVEWYNCEVRRHFLGFEKP